LIIDYSKFRHASGGDNSKSFTSIIYKPLLFAEGGEKEEKSRGKNEKAIIIIAVFPKRSIKKCINYPGKPFFRVKIPSKPGDG
jgi:hypothetical protein